MNRKDFFSRLVFGLAGIAFLKKAEADPGKKEIILSHPLVAGVQYYNGDKIQYIIQTNDPLQLIRQPDNPYDRDAIEVFYRNKKLRYIPRSKNKVIARMIDQGLKVGARVVAFDPEKPAYERIRMEIYLRQELISV